MFVIIFLIALFLDVLVGIYASSKGRSGVGFFFLALLLSPLLGFIIAMIVDPIQEHTDAKAIESGDFKKCSYCAELVRAEAIVCKHCSRDLPKVEATPSPSIALPVTPKAEICYKCFHYRSPGWDKSIGKCTLHSRKVNASDSCESFSAKSVGAG